jgi:hypothetical protein
MPPALFDFARARTNPQTMAGSAGLSDEASGADGARGVVVPPSHLDFDFGDDMASLVDSARLAGAWGVGPFQNPWVQPMAAEGEWAAFTGLANPVLDLTEFQQYVNPVLVSPACYQELPDAMAIDEQLPMSALAASPFDFGGSPQSYLTPPLSPSGFTSDCTPAAFRGTVQESDLHINALIEGSLMSPASTSRYSEPYQPSEELENGAAMQQGASKSSDQPYAQLLYQCLSEAEGHQMALRDIYDWFRRNTDKCANEELRGWQNSIRHNLSMNQVRWLPLPLFRLTENRASRRSTSASPARRAAARTSGGSASRPCARASSRRRATARSRRWAAAAPRQRGLGTLAGRRSRPGCVSGGMLWAASSRTKQRPARRREQAERPRRAATSPSRRRAAGTTRSTPRRAASSASARARPPRPRRARRRLRRPRCSWPRRRLRPRKRSLRLRPRRRRHRFTAGRRRTRSRRRHTLAVRWRRRAFGGR